MNNHAAYGLTPADVVRRLEQQGDACALCRGPLGAWVIDHDHARDVVRGIICRGCNLTLGFYERFQRNTDGWIDKARVYLATAPVRRFRPRPRARVADVALWEPRPGELPLAAARRRLRLIALGRPVPSRGPRR